MHKTVTIFIDIFPLLNTPNSGIGQYVDGVIKSLASDKRFNIKFLVFRSDNTSLLKVKHFGEIVILPYHRRIYSTLWKCGIKINVANHLDLTSTPWILYTNFGMLPYIDDDRVRTITIIHDLTYKHYPEVVTRRNLFFLQKAIPFSLAHSDFIVTPSQFTADDLQSFATIKNRRIHVAYPGYDIDGFTAETVTLPDNIPFILFLATIEPRKNVANLAEAFIAEAPSDFRLVIAGRKGWGNIVLPESPYIHTVGEVTNEQREWLLGQCSGVAFPSLFEGFGMPVLEAMRHNKPVLTSDSSSLKEIANPQNAYIIKQPYDTTSIIPALHVMLDDIRSGKASQVANRAHAETSDFTWDNCARVISDIITSKSHLG